MKHRNVNTHTYTHKPHLIMDLIWIHQVITRQHLDLSGFLVALMDLDLVYVW